MMKRSALPKGIITKVIGDTKLVRTFTGHLKMQEVVTMHNLRLPKFDKNRCINKQKVLVFDNDNVEYDIVLGTNFLSKTGIKLNYSEGNQPQLRHDPIKFGRFIKLYNINVKVLYKQAVKGFTAEAGFFGGGGEKECFAQKMGVMLHLRATDFREKNPPQAQCVFQAIVNTICILISMMCTVS